MLLSYNQQKNQTPFFAESSAPFGAPMFELIESNHYMPAFLEGINEQNKDIEAIINNPETPTFENTIGALDRSEERRVGNEC